MNKHMAVQFFPVLVEQGKTITNIDKRGQGTTESATHGGLLTVDLHIYYNIDKPMPKKGTTYTHNK